jgi:hypothetical protein
MLVVVGAGRYSRNYQGSKCSGNSGADGEDGSESEPQSDGSQAEEQVTDGKVQAAPPSAGSTCLKQFPFMKRLMRSRWVNRSTYKVCNPPADLVSYFSAHPH